MLDLSHLRYQDCLVVLNSCQGWTRNSVHVGSRPGHRGVPGNEIADSLARLATSTNRHQDVSQIRLKTVNTCVSYAYIYQHLRDHFDDVWNTQYQSDPKGTTYKAVLPTTERRLAPSPHRHSNFVPVENRLLQAAPPPFSIGSPPGWVM